MATQYIGARYVPIFAEPAEWNDTRTYEPLTIVLHEGNSYTSKQYVPAGIDIDNDKFWAETGDYNAQVEQYRQDVVRYATEVNNVSAALNAEVERATAAEKVNADAITAEQARATAAEKVNADAITETQSNVNKLYKFASYYGISGAVTATTVQNFIDNCEANNITPVFDADITVDNTITFTKGFVAKTIESLSNTAVKLIGLSKEIVNAKSIVTTANNYAVYMEDCSDNNININNISSNGTALFVTQSAENTFSQRNTFILGRVTSNGIGNGIHLYAKKRGILDSYFYTEYIAANDGDAFVLEAHNESSSQAVYCGNINILSGRIISNNGFAASVTCATGASNEEISGCTFSDVSFESSFNLVNIDAGSNGTVNTPVFNHVRSLESRNSANIFLNMNGNVRNGYFKFNEGVPFSKCKFNVTSPGTQPSLIDCNIYEPEGTTHFTKAYISSRVYLVTAKNRVTTLSKNFEWNYGDSPYNIIRASSGCSEIILPDYVNPYSEVPFIIANAGGNPIIYAMINGVKTSIYDTSAHANGSFQIVACSSGSNIDTWNNYFVTIMSGYDWN